MLRRASAVLVCVLFVGAPAPALAQSTGGEGDQIVLAGDVVVPRGTVADEVVVFSGSANVAGVAQGDVVVLQGPVTISGQVGGDVVALDGPIRLLSTAQVTGDVLAGRGVAVADGVHLGGTIRHDVRFTMTGPAAAFGALVAGVAIATSVLLVLLFGSLLAPRGLERVADVARTAPATAAAWGLAVAIAMPVVTVLAAVTVLGLPIALALALGLALVWLVGLAACSFMIGRLIARAPRSRIAAVFAGWGVMAVVGLVPFVNVAWWALASMFGIGAIVVAAWRARKAGAGVPAGRGGRHRAGAGPAAPPVIAETETASASTRPTDMPLAED
jgi:hypothetical protein